MKISRILIGLERILLKNCQASNATLWCHLIKVIMEFLSDWEFMVANRKPGKQDFSHQTHITVLVKDQKWVYSKTCRKRPLQW